MTDIPVTTELTPHERMVKEIGLIRLELVGLEERYYALRDAFYQHTHEKEAGK